MVGHRLREARIALNLSQVEVATQMGLDRNRLGKWERGVSSPPVDLLQALARLYGRSVAWLIGDADEVGVDLDLWRGVVGGLSFRGSAELELRGSPVLRGRFSEVLGGMGLEFVGVAVVRSVAGCSGVFDDTVVGMAPFGAGFLEAQRIDPGECVVVRVGGCGCGEMFPAGSMVLVDRGAGGLVDGGWVLVDGDDGLRLWYSELGGVWRFSCAGVGGRDFGPGDWVVGPVRWVGRWVS